MPALMRYTQFSTGFEDPATTATPCLSVTAATVVTAPNRC
jgi:hypothetical protein